MAPKRALWPLCAVALGRQDWALRKSMCFSTLTFSNFSTRRSEVTSAVKVSPFTLTAFDHFLPFSSGKSTPLKLGEKVQGCPLEFLVAASEAKVRGGSVD